MDTYNDSYDRVSAKSSVTLGLHSERDFHYTRIFDDPVIQELAQEESEEKATVFASDAVIAHLMAASRAVNPWDIVFTYAADMVFIDVRDQLKFELLTVRDRVRLHRCITLAS